MSVEVSNREEIKRCVTVPSKNDEKRTGAIQIVHESQVTDYLVRYVEELNKILARAGERYVLGLEFEEANKDGSVNLSKFDPIAAEFVRSLKRKIALANRKMLKSFKLKLSMEEVAP
jgi:hypothetical protein